MSYYDQVRNTVATLVMFYSPDDTKSLRMLPVINDVRNHITGSAQVLEVNVEDDVRTAEREKITELPSFAVYRYGRCVWRGSGMKTAKDLLDRLEASADPTPADQLGHHHEHHAMAFA